MIDAAAYLRENTSEKQDLIPLDVGSMMPELEIGDDNHEQKKPGSQQKNDSLDGADGINQDRVGESQAFSLPFSSSDRLLTHPPLSIGANLADQELMLCNGVVRGYSLKLNRWAKFQVDSVREVSWNEVAFSGLMLPDGYKDLRLRRHHRGKRSRDHRPAGRKPGHGQDTDGRGGGRPCPSSAVLSQCWGARAESQLSREQAAVCA
jgi:hypothetical protein